MPIRIQRQRTKGWRMQPGAVYVGRPTKWGNPFTPDMYWDARFSGSLNVAIDACVEAFRAWLEGKKGCSWIPIIEMGPPPDLSPLRGKDLACWCALDQPCHADVLLELANQ